MKRIQTLQNQLSKVLSRKDYRFSTDKLHDEFELLKIEDITKQEIASFVHKFFSNSLPSVFSGYFETLASNHNRNTRNGYNLIKIKNKNIQQTLLLHLSKYKVQRSGTNWTIK